MPIYKSDEKELDSSASALAQLILGNKAKQSQASQEARLQQDAINQNQAAAEDLAARQGLQPGKYAINASATGRSVNPEQSESMLANFLRGQQMSHLQEERDDKKVENLSKRLDSANVPESQQVLTELGNSINTKGVALNGINANLPKWMTQVGEGLGVFDEGATEQAQSLEALKAFRRNPLFGASLTPGEQKSFNDAFGVLVSGDSAQAQKAMVTLQEMYNKATQNITAGYDPRIRETYQKRGGINLSPMNIMGGAPTQAPQGGLSPEEAKELQMLEAKYGR